MRGNKKRRSWLRRIYLGPAFRRVRIGCWPDCICKKSIGFFSGLETSTSHFTRTALTAIFYRTINAEKPRLNYLLPWRPWRPWGQFVGLITTMLTNRATWPTYFHLSISFLSSTTLVSTWATTTWPPRREILFFCWFYDPCTTSDCPTASTAILINPIRIFDCDNREQHTWLDCANHDFILWPTRLLPLFENLRLTALTAMIAISGVELRWYWQIQRPDPPIFRSVFHFYSPLHLPWTAALTPPRRDIF